ncbi:MAG: hypothetical protein HYT93_04045 [Parcubacteria group bacterium]|nr:hypothetical protein [Parcubacteria group bacterium]
MKTPTFINLAIFIIFFGFASIEAIRNGDWLASGIFLVLGVTSLLADFQVLNKACARIPRKKLLLSIAIAAVIAVAITTYITVTKKHLSPFDSDTSLPEYRNAEYRFYVSLPETWRNYTVSMDTWTGYDVGDELGEKEFTHGPIVSIHNPKWTAEKLYQDIPVMVFTAEQWGNLKSGKFHIGAAPVDPNELGRNTNYVFAVPARYNFSFPLGYEEVEEILNRKPLRTF